MLRADTRDSPRRFSHSQIFFFYILSSKWRALNPSNNVYPREKQFLSFSFSFKHRTGSFSAQSESGPPRLLSEQGEVKWWHTGTLWLQGHFVTSLKEQLYHGQIFNEISCFQSSLLWPWTQNLPPLVFWESYVGLCSSSCPGTWSVEQAGQASNTTPLGLLLLCYFYELWKPNVYWRFLILLFKAIGLFFNLLLQNL